MQGNSMASGRPTYAPPNTTEAPLSSDSQQVSLLLHTLNTTCGLFEVTMPLALPVYLAG